MGTKVEAYKNAELRISAPLNCPDTSLVIESPSWAFDSTYKAIPGFSVSYDTATQEFVINTTADATLDGLKMTKIYLALTATINGEKYVIAGVTSTLKLIDPPAGVPTNAPAATDTPAPAATDTPAPAATDTPAATNTPAPGTDATPAPGTDATPAPGTDATPAPTLDATETSDTDISVKLSKSSVSIAPGASAKVNIAGASDVTISCDNKAVTAKAKNGVLTVTAKKSAVMGSTSNVTVAAGTAKATLKVKVAAKATVKAKKTATYYGAISGVTSKVKTKNIKISYSKKNIANVVVKKTASGQVKLKGLKKGSTVVTLKNGSKKLKVTVNVTK